MLGMLLMATPVYAATTAEVELAATPKYVAIADNVTTYDFGTVDVSDNVATPDQYVGITNTSTTQTDITVSTNSTTWSGGVTWTHSDTATPGADTAGLTVNTTGATPIIVKNAGPNYIYENCPALTSFDYKINLLTPTSFTDGVEKKIKVVITAAAG